MPTKNSPVVIGISGGVDSSIAAWQLKEWGHDVIGLFMKNWEEDDDESYCAAAEDLEVAQHVCQQLGVPLKTVNFSHEYWERVFKIFLQQYQAGRTPNPDILCNREIKFREFLDYAGRLGAKHIATGHYAQIASNSTSFSLRKGNDPGKDQSYFLYTLGQSELKHTLFPIGGMLKSEVRQKARALGLPNADRKDSTGICFIGERRFSDFLSRYLPPCPGQIRTLDNTVVGQHQGLWFYTLGQRHGLDIGGPGEAWYVADKDMSSNVLRVVQGHDHPALMRNSAQAEKLSWVEDNPPALPIRCSAKTRYRQADQACTLSRIGPDKIGIAFDKPQRAITPGQALVLYDGSRLIGGGVFCDLINE